MKSQMILTPPVFFQVQTIEGILINIIVFLNEEDVVLFFAKSRERIRIWLLHNTY